MQKLEPKSRSAKHLKMFARTEWSDVAIGEKGLLLTEHNLRWIARRALVYRKLRVVENERMALTTQYCTRTGLTVNRWIERGGTSQQVIWQARKGNQT
jgi:hypothetical protein